MLLPSRLPHYPRLTWLAPFTLLAGCTGVPEGTQPVSDFRIDHYLGQWYEIARLDHGFEEGLECVTAEYSRRDDGDIRVINRGYDPAEQRTRTFTGMGDDINVHDQWAVESMGAIQDRTREHLGRTDAAIREYRRLLLETIADLEAGKSPAAVDHTTQRFGPEAIDTISQGVDWQEQWRELDRERRTRSPWNASLAVSAAIEKTGTDHGRN